jgi:AraC family transcriptional regulator, positive regulator of tynA and feaB
MMIAPEAMAPNDRLAFLSEIVSRNIIEERVFQVGDAPASGQLHGKMLGGLDLIDVSGANIRAERTRAHVARTQSPFYLVSIQLSGANSFRWREQDFTASKGDLFIVDSRSAYDIDGERPFHQLVVRIPAPWLEARVARPDLVPGALVRHDNPMSQLFASFVRKGFELASELDQEAASTFSVHSIELLALALGTRSSREPRSTQALREALFVRASQVVALRFAEPDLSSHHIACAIGVSTRSLQKIFAERGTTMMRHLKETRVAQAAKLLKMPETSHRSITEIAFASGFNDSAYFTRVFSAHKDVTPSQWRQSGDERASTLERSDSAAIRRRRNK